MEKFKKYYEIELNEFWKGYFKMMEGLLKIGEDDKNKFVDWEWVYFEEVGRLKFRIEEVEIEKLK